VFGQIEQGRNDFVFSRIERDRWLKTGRGLTFKCSGVGGSKQSSGDRQSFDVVGTGSAQKQQKQARDLNWIRRRNVERAGKARWTNKKGKINWCLIRVSDWMRMRAGELINGE
jgi:hypothetical protein